MTGAHPRHVPLPVRDAAHAATAEPSSAAVTCARRAAAATAASGGEGAPLGRSRLGGRAAWRGSKARRCHAAAPGAGSGGGDSLHACWRCPAAVMWVKRCAGRTGPRRLARCSLPESPAPTAMRCLPAAWPRIFRARRPAIPLAAAPCASLLGEAAAALPDAVAWAGGTDSRAGGRAGADGRRLDAAPRSAQPGARRAHARPHAARGAQEQHRCSSCPSSQPPAAHSSCTRAATAGPGCLAPGARCWRCSRCRRCACAGASGRGRRVVATYDAGVARFGVRCSELVASAAAASAQRGRQDARAHCWAPRQLTRICGSGGA